VRLSTPKRGCSGLAYSIDYVEAAKPGDEAIPTPAGTLFVDGGSLLYLIGSVMDWVEDDFAAGFVFNNPNAKGSCGCGLRGEFLKDFSIFVQPLDSLPLGETLSMLNSVRACIHGS
jgi:iron-sulfur cluster assembly accessory protein